MTQQRIAILLVEDNPSDARLLYEALAGARGLEFTPVRVGWLRDALERLANERFEVILLNLSLPDSQGLETLRRVQAHAAAVPIVVLTGHADEELALQALHAGAQDYLVKSQVDSPTLVRALRYAMERKRGEQALREREQHLSSIYDTVADIIFCLAVEEDGRYRFTSVNRAFLLLTGLGYEQVVGQRVEEVIPQPSLTLVLEKYGEAIREQRLVRWEETSEYPRGRLTGEVSVVPVFDAVGHCVSLAGAVHDITERKRVEEALRESERRYRLLAEHVTDVIWVRDLTLQLTYVSPSVTRLRGYSVEEAMAQPWEEILTPASRQVAMQTFAEILATEDWEQREALLRARALELELTCKDGATVWTELRMTFLRDPVGQPVGLLGITRDISARKRVEAELLGAKEAAEAADRAKSEFLATMSHELRTPLNVILGYTELLLDEVFGALSGEQKETLQRVDKHGRELLDLIVAMLDISRLEAGRLPVERQEIDVAAFLQEVEGETQRFFAQAGVPCGWQVAGALPRLQTDPLKLKIVLKNLLGNALKFTKAGSITVAAQEDKGGVEISISDTGMGIPAEALARIFEPFHQVHSSPTSHAGGTGLGLYIVKRLLNLLGGTITVESEVGQGSIFRVWLPTARPL